MIAFLRGEVDSVGPDSVVLDVAGVGYRVSAAPATLAGLREGETATLPTSMVVREDSMTLFGFADADERQVFELVQTASGVGPRLALAMLASLTPDDLRRAVAAEDWSALTAVSGIGKKGAQRICLELRDRLGPALGTAGALPARRLPVADVWREQVSAALLGLGWSAREVEDSVTGLAADPVPQGPDGRPDVSALLRAALAGLNRAESRA